MKLSCLLRDPPLGLIQLLFSLVLLSRHLVFRGSPWAALSSW
jgi:hypothetical protein